MVIHTGRGGNPIHKFDSILAQRQVFSGAKTPGLGFNWALAMQIAGWTIQGVGLGLSTYDAIKGAKEQSGVQSLEPAEIQTIAASIAKADPQGRSPAQWEQVIRSQFGTAGGITPPTQVQCPPGFYPTPEGGCLPIPEEKAGFFDQLPTWAWVGGGLLAFAVFRGKLGM